MAIRIKERAAREYPGTWKWHITRRGRVVGFVTSTRGGFYRAAAIVGGGWTCAGPFFSFHRAARFAATGRGATSPAATAGTFPLRHPTAR